MRFVIDRDSLKNALAITVKGMDMNSTLPILSGVLLTATEGSLQLENTNMEVSIRQRVIANVEEPGQTVVPYKLLNDIIGHLPDMAISFKTEGTKLSITCGSSFYSLNTLSPQDFPAFPEYSLDSMVEVPTDSLNEMIARVGVAASTDRMRSILNGVLVNITPDMVRFVTTDSVRLAVAETKIVSEVENFEVIVPAKALRSVLSLAAGCKSITIGTNASQIVFLFGEAVYVTRRIEGTYPNYRKLIPTSHATGVRIKTGVLYEAMQRVKAMTATNSEICFSIDAGQNLLTITSNIPDQGNAREEIPCEVEGDDMVIAFNSRFIYDCVQKGDGDEILTFEAESPLRPGIFKSLGKVDFLYLVMPVRHNY
ncbi:MAG: DNA polymerase III subunit beta [Coriobacteriia bacterium]|nr:DNA polymerase III subunit beta [Coriobacteriia bacterium]MBS5479171.1 DNA polymerase III subunit beta [Coriobacteriia bacterium]